MSASCFSTPWSVSGVARGRLLPLARLLRRLRVADGLLPLLLLLVLGIALIAPEQPDVQADICQRHNGAAACRVW
jgi:hypothetical protein